MEGKEPKNTTEETGEKLRPDKKRHVGQEGIENITEGDRRE